MSTVNERVYDVVRRIPRGHVLSYGHVADSVPALALSAHQVGQIMAHCPADVPWHRVVARDGTLVIARRDPRMAAEQRRLLELEGVSFDPQGRVRMDLHLWSMSDTLFDGVE